jgi:hypothetical protein
VGTALNRRLAAAALPVLVPLGCGRRAEIPKAPIRLLEGKDIVAQWPAAAAGTEPAAMPAEIGAAPAGGRLGRVVMWRPDDGGDSRVALIAPAGSRYETQVELPTHHPVLQVGLGYPHAQTAPGAQLRFRIQLTPPRGPAVEILDETLTAAKDGRWTDREIPLEAWAGRRVGLRFATEGNDAGPVVWGAWSAPRSSSARRRPAGTSS